MTEVRIRPAWPADAELLAALYRAEWEFLAPSNPVRPERFFTVAGQLEELEQLEVLRAQGRTERFVIEAGEEAVGALSVSNIVRGAFHSANLGYWVARAWNGAGVATAAVGLAVEWAFGDGGLHRLEAGTLLDNAASQRVLEKNGFRRIGVARRYLHIAGAWRDHLLYARTIED